MSDKKLSVYIKTTPASMGYLHKIDVCCDFCAYYLSEDYPLCFHNEGCAVVEYIKDKIAPENITHDVKNKNNPSVSIVAKNIEALKCAHTATVKAIEYCTGKEK